MPAPHTSTTVPVIKRQAHVMRDLSQHEAVQHDALEHEAVQAVIYLLERHGTTRVRIGLWTWNDWTVIWP